MKKQNTSALSEFILRNISKNLVDGLTVLSSLKYPIHDKYSFECTLQEISDDKAIATILSQSFGPKDFPIFSTENSFEKYYDKFQPFPLPLPLIPLPPIELPDFPETPSACSVYRDTFRENANAANCACQTYTEALREGFTHLQATIIGHFAGRKYVRTGICT